VVSLDDDDPVFIRPPRTAAAFELVGDLFQFKVVVLESGDRRDAFSPAAFNFPLDADNAIIGRIF